MRKAYILQYAPDGARVLRGDETQSSGVAAHENVARVDTGLPPTSSALADDVVRQFPVLIDGQRVEPEPLPLRRA